MAVAANALCTLAQVHDHLQIPDATTTWDELLEQLIDNYTGLIEQVNNRAYKAANYVEFHKPMGSTCIVLENNPAIYVYRVATGVANALSVTYSGTDIRATVQTYDGGVRITSLAADGTQTANNVDYATYPTFSTVATQITTVADWTATVSGDDGDARNLYPAVSLDATSQAVTLTYPDDIVADYLVDNDAGTIEIQRSYFAGFDGDAQRFRGTYMVEYRGGYETIPGGLCQLTIDLVAQGFGTSKINPALQSESLGDYSYRMADIGALTEGQLNRIRSYGNLSIGGVC